jgi:hypothetical protein
MDAIDALKAKRRNTSPPDTLLLDLIDAEPSIGTRRVIAVVVSDLDWGSTLFRDAALSGRLVQAAGAEVDSSCAQSLAAAAGKIDLESTNLDARVRDLAFVSPERAAYLVPRITTAAASSPRAAKLVVGWLASNDGTVRQLVRIQLGIDLGGRDGQKLCSTLVSAATGDPNGRPILLELKGSTGCSKAQRAAVAAALR